jgi:two-component sensor histidine kinase
MAPTPPYSDLGLTLALAIVSASQAPLLLLNEDFEVVAASDTFFDTFGLMADVVVGRSLLGLGSGEWNMPRLRSLLWAATNTDVPIDPYEIDLVGRGGLARNLVLTAKRLVFVEGAPTRLLLTVVDATDTRAAKKLKDDLIRDKELLVQEVRHRVANSLQIIASVLLQNAKKVTSEESKAHLRDAHQRVMSVAAVQSQLVVSTGGDVALKPYFIQLCQSLGASMIEDHSLVAIEVNGDGSTTSGEVSVSLGLIVTELVINALKHAFPNGRRGLVTVDYHSEQDAWALSVCDDGVGMRTPGASDPQSGLGTAIVNALATQLSAQITVTNLGPGTAVSVVHPAAANGLKAAASPGLHAV